MSICWSSWVEKGCFALLVSMSRLRAMFATDISCILAWPASQATVARRRGMSKLLLVLGRSGQLATELARLPQPAGFVLEAWGRDRLDLDDPNTAAASIVALRPAAVINAAAYTMVDRAEAEPANAFLINRDAPAAISGACAQLGAPYIHISTDYVFDGAKEGSYTETDQRNPTTVYGCSKSEGEDMIIASGANATIIRTSWVYAAHGTNFLRTMLRLAESGDAIRVVADQFGRPTWAKDLARTALDVALRAEAGERETLGIFHYSGAGDASWADFAETILSGASRYGTRAAKVQRITTAEYPTTARRPANSCLDTSKIEQRLGIRPRDWREACELCLSELLG